MDWKRSVDATSVIRPDTLYTLTCFDLMIRKNTRSCTCTHWELVITLNNSHMYKAARFCRSLIRSIHDRNYINTTACRKFKFQRVQFFYTHCSFPHLCSLLLSHFACIHLSLFTESSWFVP